MSKRKSPTTVTDIVASVRRHQSPTTGLVEVPTVIRELQSAGHSLEGIRAALLEADKADAIELRPESGMGRLSADDAKLCPKAHDGTPLSWTTLRPGAAAHVPTGIKRVTLTLSSEAHAELTRIASAQGMSVAEYVRALLPVEAKR